MKKLLYILLLLVFSNNLFSQDAKQILLNMRDSLKKEKLSFATSYALYKGFKKTKLHQSYKGSFYKLKNKSYSKINKTIEVSGDKFNVKLNPDEKAMRYSKKTEINPLSFNVEESLKFCDSVVKTQKGSIWIVTLFPSIQSGLPLSKVVFEVSNQFVLKKMELFYNYKMNFGSTINPNYDFGVLSLSFTNYRTVFKFDESKLALSYYMYCKEKSCLPSDNFKGYEILF